MFTNTIDKESLIDDLYEAQEHLNEAISLLEAYVRQTGDAYAEAYLLDHLRIFAGRDHGFLSGDLNLDDLIEQLNETNEEEDEPDVGAAAATIQTSGGRTLYWCNSAGRYVSVPED